MSHPTVPGRLSREDPDLDDRQRRVFATLVALHGRSARPVGSEAVARATGLRLSAASVRSLLAELETLGLLERSHSSSGRVPSARGWQFFVRAVVEPAILPTAIVAEVDQRLSASTRDVEQLLNEASRVLASLTHQLGLALASSLEDERLVRLDLEGLDTRRALLALGVGVAQVRTLVLELDSPLERAELAEVCAVLRERLLGVTLGEARLRLAQDPELVRRSAVRIVARAAEASWSSPVDTPLLSSGAGHIAEQPEFASGAQLGPMLQLLETGAPLDRLMVAGIEGQAAVRVGLDEVRVLAACSLVSYPLPGSISGAVGVLGPLRMDYARALAVVDAVGSRVARLLQD